MALEQDIEDIRAGIKAGLFANEAAVSQGIVLRLLHALSWPTYDTRVVCPEYSLGAGRVDYALCYPPGKPVTVVEVKQIGHGTGAERQLFEYAFHAGVPMVVLTDGQEWSFFLPAERGDYSERRVYKLDMVERTNAECVARLERYLRHDTVASGAAIDNAREDYRDESKKRDIRDKLPVALQQLVDEEDEMLLEIIADRVENLCGFKPAPDTVARFLKDYMRGRITPQPIPKPEPSQPLPAPSRSPIRQPGPADVGFWLDGRHHSARNAIDVLQQVITTLTQQDEGFPERFASRKHGRKRRYLARNPEELYRDRPDLAQEYSVRLPSGWWLSTNHSRTTITRIIEMACDVAGLRYGADLRVNLGE